MGAVGYTGGDPNKVDVVGDTMTGPLVLPGDPVADLQAASKAYVDAHAGGGGSTPGNTVVTETSFGQTATAGISGLYSRTDHTHGTPPAPSIPAAGSTVIAEMSYGQVSGAGSATTYSRSDHTHGTPTAPTVPAAGTTVIAEMSYGQVTGAGSATTYSRSDHTHGTQPLSAVVALTDAATIATDASLGRSFAVTLGGNRTLGNPTNPLDGQMVLWALRQDSTGNRTLTLDTKFRLTATVTAVVLSTAAGKTDYLGARYNLTDDKWDVLAFTKAA